MEDSERSVLPFSYISDITLVSYISARYNTAILLSPHCDTTCLDEGKDLKPEIVTHPNACKGRVDFFENLLRNMQIQEFDVCWLCKCFDAVYAELSSPVKKKKNIEDVSFCFLWEKK